MYLLNDPVLVLSDFFVLLLSLSQAVQLGFCLALEVSPFRGQCSFNHSLVNSAGSSFNFPELVL